jgi:hypothetical protein
VLKIAVFAPRAASCREEKEGGGLRKRSHEEWEAAEGTDLTREQRRGVAAAAYQDSQ